MPRTGASLIDVLVTIAVLSVVVGMAAPGLWRAREVYAVRAARDAAASLVERARSLAASRGSARLIIDPGSGELRLQSPAGLPARVALDAGSAFGVTLAVDGHSSGVVQLDFNALGLGVMANRTLRFRRGGSEAVLSLSTWGRVRRW